jgi:Na+/proline symporter
LACGIFQTLASQGTDQLLVQRLLAARSKNESRAAVLGAAFLFTIQYLFFLILGVALYVFFKLYKPAAPFQTSDQVYPFFVINFLPTGLAGLVIAGMLAAVMSNAASSLNSMASSSLIDFYPRADRLSRKSQLLFSRGLSVIWALVIIGLAMLARNWGGVVEAGLTVISITYGSLLGIFLLGMLTRMRSETAGLIGMIVSLATMLAIKALTPIPFTWYFAIGTFLAFTVGWVSGQFLSSGVGPKAKEEGAD